MLKKKKAAKVNLFFVGILLLQPVKWWDFTTLGGTYHIMVLTLSGLFAFISPQARYDLQRFNLLSYNGICSRVQRERVLRSLEFGLCCLLNEHCAQDRMFSLFILIVNIFQDAVTRWKVLKELDFVSEKSLTVNAWILWNHMVYSFFLSANKTTAILTWN